MTVEIEAKIKVEHLAGYANLLKALGAKLVGDILQKDLFLDRPDRRLLNSGCGLRIRCESVHGASRTIICFKGPVDKTGNFKQRQELELVVDHPDKAQQLLNALGYNPVMTVEKKRQLWQIDRCDVCLDQLDELGCFVEIEGPDEAAISHVADRLHLNIKNHIPKSYAHMLHDLHLPK